MKSVTGAPIVPQRLQDVSPEHQGGSEIGQLMARWMNLGEDDPDDMVSPLVIDNYVQGWTGALGRLALDGGDVALRAKRNVVGEPYVAYPARETIERMPFLRAFTSNYPAGSKAVRELYDLADQTRVARRTQRYLEQSMQVDDLVDWITKSDMPLRIGVDPLLVKAQEEISELRDLRQKVLGSQMSPQEVRRTLHAIDEGILTYASSYVAAVKDLGLRPDNVSGPIGAALRKAVGTNTGRQ